MSEIIGMTDWNVGSSIEVPTRMILKFENGEFVSRYQRKDNMAEYSGGYYRDVPLEEAKEAFVERVKRHNKDYPEGNPSYLGEVRWV